MVSHICTFRNLFRFIDLYFKCWKPSGVSTLSLSVLHDPLPVPGLRIEPWSPLRLRGQVALCAPQGSSVRFPTWKEPLPASPALPGPRDGHFLGQSIRVAQVGAAGWKVKGMGVKSKMARFPKEPRGNQEAGGGTPQRGHKPGRQWLEAEVSLRDFPRGNTEPRLRGPAGSSRASSALPWGCSVLGLAPPFCPLYPLRTRCQQLGQHAAHLVLTPGMCPLGHRTLCSAGPGSLPCSPPNSVQMSPPPLVSAPHGVRVAPSSGVHPSAKAQSWGKRFPLSIRALNSVPCLWILCT